MTLCCQVVAVIQCRACGALAAALGLRPDTSHTQPGPDADASSSESLWGRVVLMRLQGSGSDAVGGCSLSWRVTDVRVTCGTGSRG